MIFDDGDYGFFHNDLSEIYMWIANRYVMAGETEKSFEYYALSFRHAKAYDELPRLISHTSFLVRDVPFDMAKTNSSVDDNTVAVQMSKLRSWGVWEAVKDTPQMKEIISKYEPFAGKKKDYTV